MKTYDHYDDFLGDVRLVLSRNFPNASSETLDEHTDDLAGTINHAFSYEFIERRDVAPEGEKKAILIASRKIFDAAKKIENLKFPGGSAVCSVAQMLYEQRNRPDALAMGSNTIDAPLEVARHLAEIAQKLEDVADKVFKFEDASEAIAELRGYRRNRGSGQPPKTLAQLTANHAYTVFESLSGRRPTVITDREQGLAGGPFLEFLADLFSHLEIDASPETWARSACRERMANEE